MSPALYSRSRARATSEFMRACYLGPAAFPPPTNIGDRPLPRDELDPALSRAIHEVLGPRMAMMLHVVASAERPREAASHSDAVIEWLKENMPRTAERVLARVREAA
jgi:hypothetical protein